MFLHKTIANVWPTLKKGGILAINIADVYAASKGDGKSFRKMPGNYYKPDFKHLVETIKDAYENFEKHKQEALQISERVRRDFSWDKQAKLAHNRLQVIYDENFKDGKYINKVQPKIAHNFVYKAFVQVEKSDEDLMVTAAKNTDGSIAVVIFNEGTTQKSFQLSLGSEVTTISINAQAIQTILINTI